MTLSWHLGENFPGRDNFLRAMSGVNSVGERSGEYLRGVLRSRRQDFHYGGALILRFGRLKG